MPRFRPHAKGKGTILAQECCSYQAMTELLEPIDGDLAVLVHGDRDCSNVLGKHDSGRGRSAASRFLCTNVREDEMVGGRGNRKLRQAIELVARERSPELLVVLSTCPTVMTGDNVLNITRQAGRDLGIRASGHLTHGLKPMAPAQVLDIFYKALTEAAEPSPGDVSRRVNLVGFSLDHSEKAEVTAVLEAMGLALNAVLSPKSRLDDFMRAGAAGLNVHPGPDLLRDFRDRMEERFEARSVEVPLPVGLASTDAFYGGIAATAGVSEEAVQRALTAHREPAAAAIESFRGRFSRASRPLRVAYNIGSMRSFDLRFAAEEGLAALSLFGELGFAAKLFIQGPQHEDNWDRVARVLAERGFEGDFVIFPDPGSLAGFLARDELDLWYGVGFMREQLRRARLDLFDVRRTRLGYGGIVSNVASLGRVLADDFYGRFGSAEQAAGDTEKLDEMLRRGKGRVIASEEGGP